MRRAAALALGLIAMGVAVSPAGASPYDSCHIASRTYLANAQARIYYASGDPDFVYLCRRHGRRATLLAAPLPLKYLAKGGRGSLDIHLAGPFASFREVGEGCSISDCVGPVAYIYNAERPSRPQRLVGAVDLVVRSDGAYAAIYTLAPPGQGSSGATAGPGPFRVITQDANGRTIVDDAPGIQPGSLALRDSRVYWSRDGQPQTSVLR